MADEQKPLHEDQPIPADDLLTPLADSEAGDTEPLDPNVIQNVLSEGGDIRPGALHEGGTRGLTSPQLNTIAEREGKDSAPTDGLGVPNVPDVHEMPTSPLDEQQAGDPKKTLAGSGGYDPNPDFLPPNPGENSTVPHIVPFQHTLVHVPGETRRPVQPSPARQQLHQNYPIPPAMTQPNVRVPTPASSAAPVPTPPQPGAPMPQGVPRPGVYGAPPMPPRRRKAARRGFLGCSPTCLMVFAGLIVTFCGGLTLLTLLLTATLGAELEQRYQAQVERVDDYDNFESTFYYDRSGTLLYEAFTEGRRENVSYSEFPQDLINATVAVEDDTFFTNPGFEVQATTRAFLQYIGIGGDSTGGSTITQQVVRNILFDFEYRSERSIQRKVEEILLAFLLRQRKTPEEVLELYLNEIYYGNLAYGAQAAARTLFDKDVSQLTLGESALLAGLPQIPAYLDPLSDDPQIQAAVEARWRLVLDRMVQERFITDQQRNEALSQGLSYRPPEVPLRAPHFTVFARQQLDRLLEEIGYSPERIARGGLKVYTTVDLRINDMAQRIARDQVAGLAGNNVSNAAVIVLKPVTGEILAMVGSIDYDRDDIDGRVNVTISPRQPGSTMKPLTYAAAMEQGMTPADILWDTETVIGDYRPVNYDRTYRGPVRMRAALANSLNIPAVQTLRRIGVPSLLEIASRFGVNSLGSDASQYGLSLTLGGGEMTLLELTRAYTVFANGGAFVPSTAILCVLDNQDNVIYEYEDGCPRGNTTPTSVIRDGYGRQVLDPRIAFVISDILADNNARAPVMGSNSPLNTGDLGTSVKTGTTDDFRDNWTVGYTRNVAVGVWVGNSSGAPMVNSTGLTGAAPIWNSVITSLHADQNMLRQFAIDGNLFPDRLEQPAGLSLSRFCNPATLRDPAVDCGSSIQEWWLDTPAAVMDANGNLTYPAPTPPPADMPPPSGPWLREVEPDIYRVLAQRIPPEIAQGIRFAVQPGQATPPAPLYCQVPIEAAPSAPGAQELLFIAPPPVPDDAARAEAYARSQGIAFLPTIACSPELLAGGGSPVIVTAFISQPTPGQEVTENIPIIGTAQFGPGQAQYFKLEISGGQFGSSWVTMEDVRYDSVVNGQLGTLPASALAPGEYRLQLVVVGNDGNYVQPPYQVTFIRR